MNDFELGFEIVAEMTTYHPPTRSGDHWTEFTDAGIQITLIETKKPGKILVKVRKIPLLSDDEDDDVLD